MPLTESHRFHRVLKLDHVKNLTRDFSRVKYYKIHIVTSCYRKQQITLNWWVTDLLMNIHTKQTLPNFKINITSIIYRMYIQPKQWYKDAQNCVQLIHTWAQENARNHLNRVPNFIPMVYLMRTYNLLWPHDCIYFKKTVME